VQRDFQLNTAVCCPTTFFFVEQSYAESHETLTGGLIVDTRPHEQTDVHGSTLRRSFLLRK
jgi:hypothetical protein